LCMIDRFIIMLTTPMIHKDKDEGGKNNGADVNVKSRTKGNLFKSHPIPGMPQYAPGSKALVSFSSTITYL